MGLAPEKGSVVDANLKVYGVQGLRIADSSVIPVIPGVPIIVRLEHVVLYPLKNPIPRSQFENRSWDFGLFKSRRIVVVLEGTFAACVSAEARM